MGNEATITIVARMEDDASQQMQDLGKSTAQTAQEAFNLQLALTATGSALTAVGSLMNQVDNPAMKMASNFLMIGGALMSTTAAVMMMLPYIKSLIIMLRGLAVMQAIVAALAGPAGWVKLAAGLAIAGGATAAVYGMSGGFSGGGGTTVNVNVGAMMGNEADARRFSSMIDKNIKGDRNIGR